MSFTFKVVGKEETVKFKDLRDSDFFIQRSHKTILQIKTTNGALTSCDYNTVYFGNGNMDFAYTPPEEEVIPVKVDATVTKVTYVE